MKKIILYLSIIIVRLKTVNFDETFAGINFLGPSPSERGLGVRAIPARFSMILPDNSVYLSHFIKKFIIITQHGYFDKYLHGEFVKDTLIEILRKAGLYLNNYF